MKRLRILCIVCLICGLAALSFAEVSKRNATITDIKGKVEVRTSMGSWEAAKAGMVLTGTLGAVLVKDIKSGIEFSIGSGFNDENRQEIWDNQKKYLGKIVKYKSQKCGEVEKPRFPVFLSFRDVRDMSD